MANPEHLYILKQGVEVWNKWREDNPYEVPDFLKADLHGLNLSNADFYVYEPNRAALLEAMYTGANPSQLDLLRTNFREANLRGVRLRDADLTAVDFCEADLSRADLSGTQVIGAWLNKANMQRADLRSTRLMDVNLRDANLSGAHLIETDIREADLDGANLTKSLIRDVTLYKTYFNNVDLSEADLDGVNFSNVDLNNANFSRSKIVSCIFGDNDLSLAKGLETIIHKGPSSIGIDTIYRSKGNIPELFLKGCGVPGDFITYVRSLTMSGSPIQFYSCFISYSSKDQRFADRLYADLQNKGVRCWFAPEDLKIGDKIRDRIDESIRLRDKLLLILSEQSIVSEWVEHEVESALEEEKQRGRTILFPIRVDDVVMESSKAWAALIRRTRHIGDFTHWKDHDSYQKAFDRLLRDLKAEEKSPNSSK